MASSVPARPHTILRSLTLGASDNLHRRELARDWTLLSNESSNGALCWNDTASAFAGTSCTAANLILDNASAPVYCLDNPNFLLYCPVDRRSVASPFVWQPGVSPSVPLTLDNTCYNSKAIAVSETYPSCTAATIARGGDVGSPCFNPQRPDAYEFYCPTAYDQRWSGPPPPPAAVLAPFTNSSGLLCFRTEALVRAYTVCGIVPGHPLYALGFGAFGGNAKSGYPCGGEFPWFCDTSRAPSEAPNVQFCYETRSQAEGDCFELAHWDNETAAGGLGPCSAAGGRIFEEFDQAYQWYCAKNKTRFTQQDCERFATTEGRCPIIPGPPQLRPAVRKRWAACEAGGRKHTVSVPGRPEYTETYCKVVFTTDFWCAVLIPSGIIFVSYVIFVNLKWRCCPLHDRFRPDLMVAIKGEEERMGVVGTKYDNQFLAFDDPESLATSSATDEDAVWETPGKGGGGGDEGKGTPAAEAQDKQQGKKA